MVVHKRRKFTRQRGSHTHGWGSKKKHRGAGSRGGRGKAGIGKRAHHQMEALRRKGFFLGNKIGFKRPRTKKIKIITLDTINHYFSQWLKENKIEEKSGHYFLDLTKLGYDKLLSGRINCQLEIKVNQWSKGAEKKLRDLGGQIHN